LYRDSGGMSETLTDCGWNRRSNDIATDRIIEYRFLSNYLPIAIDPKH
jgi:hypothetical protein